VKIHFFRIRKVSASKRNYRYGKKITYIDLEIEEKTKEEVCALVAKEIHEKFKSLAALNELLIIIKEIF
jgi:hypothetical protein